jgi:hypothetical protein
MFGKSGAARIVDIRGAVLSAGTVDDTPTEQEGSASFLKKISKKLLLLGVFARHVPQHLKRGFFASFLQKKEALSISKWNFGRRLHVFAPGAFGDMKSLT